MGPSRSAGAGRAQAGSCSNRMVSCALCGGMFASRNALFKHLQEGCPGTTERLESSETEKVLILFGYTRTPAATDLDVSISVEAVLIKALEATSSLPGSTGDVKLSRASSHRARSTGKLSPHDAITASCGRSRHSVALRCRSLL